MMPHDSLITALREMEDRLDDAAWPDSVFPALADAGCWRAVIPRRYGGDALGVVEQMALYERVAAGSLSVALILTQHDRACELIAAGTNPKLAESLLPRASRGEMLATVGISQLTTSTRGPGPAMRAIAKEGGFLLDGLMPWVTSAKHADVIVTGAVLPDGLQVVAAIPAGAGGMHVDEPMHLMALQRSWTSAVRCRATLVSPDHVLRGPMPDALGERAPVKSFVVTSVGIGVAGTLLDGIRAEHERSPDVAAPVLNALTAAYRSARSELFDAGAAVAADETADFDKNAVRARINDLIVRLAATNLTLAKGSGYVAAHPAQRAVREAMFFLVWSAPKAVQTATLQHLWQAPGR